MENKVPCGGFKHTADIQYGYNGLFKDFMHTGLAINGLRANEVPGLIKGTNTDRYLLVLHDKKLYHIDDKEFTSPIDLRNLLDDSELPRYCIYDGANNVYIYSGQANLGERIVYSTWLFVDMSIVEKDNKMYLNCVRNIITVLSKEVRISKIEGHVELQDGLI